MANNCYQREHDARNGKLQQGNYASTSNQGDEQLFVMQHMANSMMGGVLDNNVWYVDFGVSNHMTSHGEWFRDTKDLKTPRFVEIDDDHHTLFHHHTNWQGAILYARWANKVLERCTSCSNHNKKFVLCR
jgi:hypothetical protein